MTNGLNFFSKIGAMEHLLNEEGGKGLEELKREQTGKKLKAC